MRVRILQDCVVAGSVWRAGEVVYVDEAIGEELVRKGLGVGVEEAGAAALRPYEGGKVEKAVGKRERDHDSS